MYVNLNRICDWLTLIRLIIDEIKFKLLANHPKWRRWETGTELQKVTPLQTRCLPKPILPSNSSSKVNWRSSLRVRYSMSVKRYSEIGRQAQFHAWNPSDLPELNELLRVRKWSRAMDAICPPTPFQTSIWTKKCRNLAWMPPLGEYWRQQPILPYKAKYFGASTDMKLWHPEISSLDIVRGRARWPKYERSNNQRWALRKNPGNYGAQDEYYGEIRKILKPGRAGERKGHKTKGKWHNSNLIHLYIIKS